MPTFRISRGGSFAGLGSLDPFGTSRGGLGRYQMSDVASLNATEAYAVAVGWQNGTVSDAAYIASLEKALALEPAGTTGWITANNKLGDARYTIARNALVNQVNMAVSSSTRIAALEALVAHDQARLGSMDPSNEQQRELQYRILSSQADIRQTRYGDMVEQLNAGFLTTDQLIEYVKGAMTASVGAPDADDWKRTMDDLVGRKNDEYMAVLAQDYQQGRDPQGKKFLAAIDAQLGLLVPGSPKYDALTRQREDLTKAIRADTLATAHADIYDRWQRGKITDAQYLKDLERAVKEAPAGSRERADAEQRLVMTRFSLAEDKLRDDVNKGKASVGQLIRFYESTLRSMVPGSQRARQIAATIRDLRALGGSGSGSGSGEPKGTIKGIAKVLFPGEPWKVVAGATKDVNGRPIPKGSILSALTLNASNSTERGWFNKNLARLAAAEQLGATTWLFLDKNGNEFEIAYSDDLHRQFLASGIAAWDAWRVNAKTPKAALQAAGERFSKEKALASLNRGLVMDEYGDQFGKLEEEKQEALLTGNIAAYVSATNRQRNLIRDAGGIDGDPSTVATSIENMTAPLTPEQKDRLAYDIDRIAPFQPDPLNPDDPLNMDGDRIMWAIESGVLTYDQYQDVDGSPAVRNVRLVEDVSKGLGAYWTQNAGGQTVLVTPFDRPADFAPITRVVGGKEVMAFAYQAELTPIVTYGADPGDLAANFDRAQTGTNQPVTMLWMKAGQSLMASVTATVTTFSGGKVVIGGPADRGPSMGYGAYGQPTPISGEGNTARTSGLRFAMGQGIKLYSQTIMGWIPDPEGGFMRGKSTWVSVEPPGTAGAIWMRLPEGGKMPEVMFDPDLPTRFGQQPSATFGFGDDGSLGLVGADGKVGPMPPDAYKYARFWRVDDARGAAEVGTGARGMDLDWTVARFDGAIDTWRPAYRPERETRETIGTNGEMVNRPYNEVAATVEQRAARLARARGTAGPRNVDRDSYYDPVSKRWKSDLVAASAPAGRGLARDRWYEDVDAPPTDLSPAGRLRGVLGSSTLQGAITPGMMSAAKLRSGPLPVGHTTVNSVPAAASSVPTINPVTGFTIQQTVRPPTPGINPVSQVKITPRTQPGTTQVTTPSGGVRPLTVGGAPQQPGTIYESNPAPVRAPRPSNETPVLRPISRPVPR